MKKAVFLDKDGTVIKNVHYNADPSKVELERYAGSALLRLQQAGYTLVIVSNQAGVALGYFSEAQLAEANRAMIDLLKQEGVAIDGVYYCPHHNKGVVKEYAVTCGCRKPAAGMLLQAAGEMSIKLSRSWMVGDIADDMEAGKKAGCATILVNPAGNNEKKEMRIQFNEVRDPDYVAADLDKAADIILSNRHRRYV